MTIVSLLGSTGSIGTSTLDVVRHHPKRFQIFGLAAGENWQLLARQIAEFRPKIAGLSRADLIPQLCGEMELLGLTREDWPELVSGPRGLVEMATAAEVHTVVSAIVGVGGLEATYEAARRGKRIGLANKESLVSAGRLVMDAVRTHKAELLPIDSEHNGAHQCFRAGARDEVARLILTASGGPFRNTPKHALEAVTPAQALAHPTWKMGNRITIDSATLMNKGFEVIEACWLFDLRPSEVDVVIHPQSSVHAMVEYNDGSILAQVSTTDMRMPIQYALTWPDRLEAPVPRVDWTQARQWEFTAPDTDRFPLLRLAYEAQEAGASETCTLNAADEVAVAAFLNEEIGFLDIVAVVSETLSVFSPRQARSIGDILSIDAESRTVARQIATNRSRSKGRQHPIKVEA